jgi:hypothetical protein
MNRPNGYYCLEADNKHKHKLDALVDPNNTIIKHESLRFLVDLDIIIKLENYLLGEV